jgi:hypothetical protein
MTELFLTVIPDTNVKTIIVKDTGFYEDKNSVENLLFEILSPSSSKWVNYKVNPEFIFVLNASNLRLCTISELTKLPNLDDGIYEFKISYKPNFGTHKLFYHLNTKNLLKQYWDEVENLYSKQCSITKRDFEFSRDLLIGLKMDLDAAKWIVEEKHKKKEGLELYNRVKEDLKKYKDGCSNCG